MIPQPPDQAVTQPGELWLELFVYASALFDEGWSSGLNAFDTIEPKILGLGAQQVPEQLAETLKRYIKVIEDHVGSYPFEYAEGVARRMNQVFNNSAYPELRALSLEATLIAAVSLNRFAAMDTFAANLKKVKDVREGHRRSAQTSGNTRRTSDPGEQRVKA